MPFSNIPWWMRLYQPQATQGFQQDDSLPPPAAMGPDPSELIAPTGGGDPIDRSAFTPYPTPAPTAAPSPFFTPSPQEVTSPVEPEMLPSPDFGPPSTTATSNSPTAPPGVGGLVPDTAFPPGAKVPLSAYPSTGTALPPGQGNRQDDSGQVPGVDLSPTDKANIALNRLGLPPLPTGYNPFGGMPSGFTESNAFGGGAPTFTPPGFTGPNWSPGGSIFGGTLSPTGWVVGGGNPGNLGGSGGNLGGFGNILGQTMFRHAMKFGQYPTDAFGARVGTWTDAIRNNYLANGLPNPNAFSRANTRGMGSTGQGMGGAGRPMTANYQFGGVAGDDDFYAGIGAKTYAAGRQAEDKASHIFSALGELGKYLGGGHSPAAMGLPPAQQSESPMGGQVSGLMKWLTNAYPDDPPGLRDMPRSPDYQTSLFGYPFRERNTEVIPGQPQPEGTPYPRPPFLNFGNWLRTGERGPVPLDTLRPGNWPSPANRQIPEAYEARTSGGALASTDTVPAMLTPGEVVLDKKQQSAVMPVPGREHMLLPNQRARLAKRMWS